MSSPANARPIADNHPNGPMSSGAPRQARRKWFPFIWSLGFRSGTTRRRRRASVLTRYGVALGATALALVARIALGNLIAGSGPFLLFAPAVMISAWYGGFGPGMLASVLGSLAGNYFLLEPRGRFTANPDDLIKMSVFLTIGAVISWLSGALLAAHQRVQAHADAIQAAHDKLEERVAERTAELQFQKTLLEAQSNASLDGILFVSDESRVIYHNCRLPDLWNLPDSAFGGSLDEVVQLMRSRLADHQNPLAATAPVGLPLEGDAPANLVLQDGRTLECHSAPVRSSDGRSYGRVWYFRDITERKRLAKQILEAGEHERQRIGQDLHDDLCQHLTGIGCLGRVLQQRLTSRLPGEAQTAGRVVDLVEQAVFRARDLARGLQPPQLRTGDLLESLQTLATNIESMFHVQCHLRCNQPLTIVDPAAPVQLYRITQEA